MGTGSGVDAAVVEGWGVVGVETTVDDAAAAVVVELGVELEVDWPELVALVVDTAAPASSAAAAVAAVSLVAAGIEVDAVARVSTGAVETSLDVSSPPPSGVPAQAATRTPTAVRIESRRGTGMAGTAGGLSRPRGGGSGRRSGDEERRLGLDELA